MSTAQDVQFDDGNIRLHTSMLAYFAHPRWRESSLPGFHIIYCNDVTNIVPKQHIRPNTAELAMSCILSSNKAMFNIGKIYTAQPSESDCRSESA